MHQEIRYVVDLSVAVADLKVFTLIIFSCMFTTCKHTPVPVELGHGGSGLSRATDSLSTGGILTTSQLRCIPENPLSGTCLEDLQ